MGRLEGKTAVAMDGTGVSAWRPAYRSNAASAIRAT
jgi:hypothetical protein